MGDFNYKKWKKTHGETWGSGMLNEQPANADWQDPNTYEWGYTYYSCAECPPNTISGSNGVDVSGFYACSGSGLGNNEYGVMQYNITASDVNVTSYQSLQSLSPTEYEGDDPELLAFFAGETGLGAAPSSPNLNFWYTMGCFNPGPQEDTVNLEEVTCYYCDCVSEGDCPSGGELSTISYNELTQIVSSDWYLGSVPDGGFYCGAFWTNSGLVNAWTEDAEWPMVNGWLENTCAESGSLYGGGEEFTGEYDNPVDYFNNPEGFCAEGGGPNVFVTQMSNFCPNCEQGASTAIQCCCCPGYEGLSQELINYYADNNTDFIAWGGPNQCDGSTIPPVTGSGQPSPQGLAPLPDKERDKEKILQKRPLRKENFTLTDAKSKLEENRLRKIIRKIIKNGKK